MSHLVRPLYCAALMFGLAACSGGRGHHGIGPGGGDGGQQFGDGGSINSSNCAAGAELVYLVDEHNALFSFTPNTLTFSEIGPLSCPVQMPGATPFSMGVDRSATAWVLYSDGELFQVSTSSASCTATNFQIGQQGFDLFGMGFASDTAGGMTDTLYIAGGDFDTGQGVATSAMLGTLSFPGLTVSEAGTVNGQPELTGSGAGDLWGFFPTKSGSSIEKLDKTSGSASLTYQVATNHGQPAAWAFAYWGGDLWAFLQTQDDPATVVYQVDGTTGALKASTPTQNRIIVGAGVSTCAPTTIE